MKAACEEFGMKFVMETAPDPTSDVGVAGAQAYILEKVPEWSKTYGEKAAYFCTNDAHTEPLLKQLLQYGGYFIEADLPSPLMGYPGALGIDLTAVSYTHLAPRMATARRTRLLFSKYSPWVDTGGSPPRPKSPLTQARAEDREEASKSTKPRTTAARV